MMKESNKSPVKKPNAKDRSGKVQKRKRHCLTDTNKNLRMVLLLLSAHGLDIKENDGSKVYDFVLSQRAAYAAVSTRPIFGGLNNMEVDTDWALHLINFFRGHMLSTVETTLHARVSELALTERPQMWNKKLSNNPGHIGRWWKGTYAYLEQDEVCWIRDKDTWNRIFQDKNVDNADAIQMVQFWVPEANTVEPWNPLFEQHLKSTTNWDSMKNPNAFYPQHRLDSECEPQVDDGDMRQSYRFEGLGYDDEEFFASGWINPIASQRGVPGWNRMSMMKYFKNTDGSLDYGALWAYEGVILPGGNMIVGRWWAADPAKSPEDQYSGPFILWNVDASEPEPGVSLKELRMIERMSLTFCSGPR
jgi:hypothetical protein